MAQYLVFLVAFVFATNSSANCLTVDPKLIKSEWTAFKFTEKKAVKGSFSKTEITLPKDPKNLSTLILGTQAKIDGRSVETGDPGRNANIASGFFEKMKGGPEIRVSFTSVKKNQVKAQLKMNGSTRTVTFKMIENDKEVLLESTIDVLEDLKASAPFESIQALCKDLHKGADGISKLWTTVDLKITLPTHCDKK
ncbi:MAG: YceI family protein [Bdellovibrionales bacterium]|nr:YceI family protein [Bdellovibrionales bacterium]